MEKLKQALHYFFVSDVKRGEKWLLVLGIILPPVFHQISEISFNLSPAEGFLDEATMLPSRQTKTDSTLHIAKSLIGVPYRYAGNGPSEFDCSGFINYVYDQVDIPLEGASYQQFQQGDPVQLTDAQPGDLIFFRIGGKVDHVGIVTKKNDKKTFFIHASASRGVVVDYLENSYFLPRLAGIRRVISS